ncbi:MAG: hypothetical protein Kow0029_03420 [Candidatus Rifleibacteriota bacterium]
MRNRILLVILMITLVAPECLLSVDLSSSEIINIEGRVEVKKGDKSGFKKLNKNLKLSGSLKRLDGGDKVKTYLNSTAEMALKETCILAVKEQSLFEVPKTLGRQAVAQLKAQQGSLLFKVISGNNFQVKTADVIAGVKGTLFEMDIVDSFDTLLETPSLELGTIAPGGTMVNVYRGEVELTHATTGKSRRLAAGEGITVFNGSLLKLSSALRDGFGKLRKFEPANLLREKFGSEAVGLLNLAPNLSSLTSFAGTGSFKSSLGTPLQRLTSLFSGMNKDVVKSVLKEMPVNIDTGIGLGLEELYEGFKNEKYKADFSGYSAPKSAFSLTDRSMKEVYVGNATFAAGKASLGAKTARVEPTPEGLTLVEGNAAFKFLRYRGNSPDMEFEASYYESDGQQITSVEALKGDLYGRFPGELEVFKIPAGKVSYVFNTSNGQGAWVQADSRSLPVDVNTYKFKVAEKIEKEKAAVEKRNTKKKINTIKKIFNRKFGF